MDFEAPVDAWYVWLGVAIASVALAGIALSLPSQPPPDATGAANAIDTVAGSTQTAEASVEHDADELRIDTARLSMRNDGGTARASIAFGPLTPIAAVESPTEREALRAILSDGRPSTVLERPEFESVTESELRRATEDARANRTDSPPDWQPASDELRVRKLELDGESVVLVEG